MRFSIVILLLNSCRVQVQRICFFLFIRRWSVVIRRVGILRKKNFHFRKIVGSVPLLRFPERRKVCVDVDKFSSGQNLRFRFCRQESVPMVVIDIDQTLWISRHFCLRHLVGFDSFRLCEQRKRRFSFGNYRFFLAWQLERNFDSVFREFITLRSSLFRVDFLDQFFDWNHFFRHRQKVGPISVSAGEVTRKIEVARTERNAKKIC